MKALLKSYLLLITLIILLSTACKKEDSIFSGNMPAPTQVGANVFECKVNGKIWEAKVTDMFYTAPKIKVDFSYRDHRFEASGNIQADHVAESIDINIFDWNSTGVFKLGGVSKNQGSFDHIQPEPGIVYSTDRDDSGMVNVTKVDTINHILSGTFNFNAKEPYGTGVTHITEGQFDYKY